MKIIETVPVLLTEAKYESETQRPGVLGKFGGVFQRAEAWNGNKRKYPRRVFEQNLRPGSEFAKRLANRQVVGELNHPKEGTAYERVSHIITEVELGNDNVVYGKGEILDTPHGKILDTLFRAGVTVGVSSRGDGSTRAAEEEGSGHSIVEDDFIMETWDAVVHPSTHAAFPKLLESQQQLTRIAEAFEALVKGTQDPKVLRESLRIITELAQDGDPLTSVGRAAGVKLKEVLHSTPSSSQQSTAGQPPQKERTMLTQPNNGQAGNPKNTADRISEMATKLAQSQVKAVQEAQAGEQRRLLEQVSSLQSELTKERGLVAAAEKLVEEFQVQNRVLQEKIAAQGTQGKNEATLRKYYSAAESLLEAALGQIDKLKLQAQRAEAAEKLIAGLIEQANEGRRKTFIESLVTGHPAEKQLRTVLEGQSSVAGIRRSFEELREAFGGAPLRREPLPGQPNQVSPNQLGEARQPTPLRPTQKSTNPLHEGLLARIR